MPGRSRLGRVCLCAMALLWFALTGNARQAATADEKTIECRAIEVHASATPAVTAIVFHQQDKNEQERIAAVLRAHSGEAVEIRIGEGKWTGATMFRLKNCFGRGLLLLPTNAPELKDGSTFLLRVSSAAGKS